MKTENRSLSRGLLLLTILMTLSTGLSAQREKLLIMTAAKLECQKAGMPPVSKPVLSVTLDNGSFGSFGGNITYTITGPGLPTPLVLQSSTAGFVAPTTHTFIVQGLQHGSTYTITATSGVVGGNSLTFVPNLTGCRVTPIDIVDNPVLPPTGSGSDCIDFDTPPGDITHWSGYGVSGISFINLPGYNNVLTFKDANGASLVYNGTSDFQGNWLVKGDSACFCFDYKVDWNAGVATTPVYAPKINIYSGANPPNFQKRAAFVGFSSNAQLPDNVWQRFCLPIALCSNGQLPSNNFGTWQVFDYSVSSSALTGTAACNTWNTIITNVSGIALASDYNDQPSEIVCFDNFCWTCDSIESNLCCPGENLISNGDFENGNNGFTSGYSYQTPPSANSVTPGMYSLLNSTNALTVSSTWNAADHSTCTSSGNFMVVNGTTGQASGPRLVWEQNVGVQPNKDYRFCAWFRDLKQCSFNVLPNVEIRLTLPSTSPIISNTIINTLQSNPCDWQLVSQTINTGPASSLNIQIWLDEGPDGDGNDLALDDINLKQMSQFAAGAAQFNVATTWSNATTYSVTATPNSILFPPAGASGCGYFWEVCEVDNAGNCLPGTMVTNPSQWWTGATNFPGYNGTSTLTTTPSGIFQIGHRYKIRYGIWCDCYSWSQSVLIIEYSTRMQRLLIKEEKDIAPTGSR